MTLRDLPPVRALAEERARAMYESMRTVSARDAGSRAPELPARSYPRPWAELNDDTRAWWTDAALDLLCDMGPDSRDAVARLVAAKMGLVRGATAPQWAQEEYHVDGERTACWILSSKDRSVVFYGDYDSGPDGYSVYRRVSGVDNITDPADALARVAIAVLA